MAYIYKIEHLFSGKVYIGQTIHDIAKRWYQHKYMLVNQIHSNQYLQRAWNKYGEAAFEFSIILECEDSEASYYEEEYINRYGGINSNDTYNLIEPGVGGKLSEDVIESLSGENAYWFGKTLGEEHRKKISVSLTGKTLSEEVRRKMSMSGKGRVFSKEHKKNISNALTGKTRKEETKRKISQTRVKRGVATGERNPSAKLTEKEVTEIRKLYSTGKYTKVELGVRYNVTDVTIYNIVNYNTWRNLP